MASLPSFKDESQSRGWSKAHRHHYLHQKVMTEANRPAIGYYLANPTTSRCLKFSELSHKMYKGIIPIDTKVLLDLLAEIDEERKVRTL